jgi:hypothetical protein
MKEVAKAVTAPKLPPDIASITQDMGPQSVTFHFCTEGAARRFYSAQRELINAIKAQGGSQ